MLNIIKSDLYRLVRSKSLYIVIALIIVLAGISVVTLSPGHIGISVQTSDTMMEPDTLQKISEIKTLGDFRRIMKDLMPMKLDAQIIGQNSNLYYLFIVFVVVVLTSDFSNKSVKNTLSSAISRREYFMSKLITLLGIGTVFVLFNNYFNYALNYVVNGEKFTSGIGYITKITVIQLPVIYAIICMLVCIAFVVRKTSTFNTVSIPFFMVLQVISMIVFAIIRETPEWYTKYELQNALANLSNHPSNVYIIKCCVIGILYMIGFSVVGYYAFKNAEIK